MDNETKEYLDAMKAELNAHMEAVETKLLAEFWKWGRAADMRIRRAARDAQNAVTDTGDFSERMSSLEDRVSELERHDK